MRALPKKFIAITADATPVRDWRKAKQIEISRAVERVESKLANAAFACGLGFTLLLLFTLFGVLASEGGDGEIHWSAFLTWMSVIMGIDLVAVLGFAIGNGVHTETLRARTRERLEREAKANPLVARAELLVRATQDFTIHCDRYRAWRQQVEEELIMEDAEAAERYFAFLDHAYEVITRAIANFVAVAERVRREEAYLKEHPELRESDAGTGLTLLLDELRADIEQPEIPGTILNPTRALAHEEALAEIVADLEVHEIPATS